MIGVWVGSTMTVGVTVSLSTTDDGVAVATLPSKKKPIPAIMNFFVVVIMLFSIVEVYHSL
jgi:hypothetical protein